MGELIFIIYTTGLNLEDKKEILRFIFYSYMKLFQNQFNQMEEEDFYKYTQKEEHDMFFNYSIQEKEGKYILSKESNFGISFTSDFEIRGDVIEYSAIQFATSINDYAKEVNNEIIAKYKKNIKYMNITTEALNILDQGNGNLYYQNVDVFFEILKEHSFYYINDSDESKKQLCDFLKKEKIILDNNDEINLIGHSKYPERKKIYDYLLNQKIVIKKSNDK